MHDIMATPLRLNVSATYRGKLPTRLSSGGLAIRHVKSAFLNESGKGDLQAHRRPDNGGRVGL